MQNAVHPGYTLLGAIFDPQNYSLALPTGSEERKKINEMLLKRQADDHYWRKLTSRFLGQ